MKVVKCIPANSCFAPYIPGEQPPVTKKIVKLNTNENPYPPSPEIKKVVKTILSKGLLRKYSNPVSANVIKEIAKLHKIPESHIMVTNGSDEGLAILFRATLGPGEIALMPFQKIHELQCMLVGWLQLHF